MIDRIEQDARSAGYKGVVAWAMDWDWNPASFYAHMGYAPVDREDKVVVLWKPFSEDAQPPRLLRLDPLPESQSERVRVVVADNPWCNNNDKLAVAREAVAGIEPPVDQNRFWLAIGTSLSHYPPW
jgi:hypothetical protein